MKRLAPSVHLIVVSVSLVAFTILWLCFSSLFFPMLSEKAIQFVHNLTGFVISEYGSTDTLTETTENEVTEVSEVEVEIIDVV